MKILLKRVTCFGFSFLISLIPSKLQKNFNGNIHIFNPVVIAKSTKNKSCIVYITKKGKHYHKSGCRHLRKSCISTNIKYAERHGYTPCNHCFP